MESYRCHDCDEESEPTSTALTLISPKHGWRVMRSKAESGEVQVVWRCASCWAAYRAASPTMKKAG